ncbi:methyl-coenzyme M reductase operon protein D [Methanofollis fontis]|uniref:Methyl-coenzyme M reductase operon protein D n=1 Tax=Methanofollis fontis TaxID=2052832 RepID=A0A483CQJ0_9EURY|nr:methyl-coenzyme M reductase operon protein D [Methanofollis fontis]TAJ44451.1 methyl-coenzyme M reductase operon protein D [Methanofollis fontis]
MPDSAFPQCRIVPLRLLSPQTAEKFLGRCAEVPGIRRIVINGPGLPATVPYGPARGSANPNSNRRTIQVGGAAVEMKVQAGTFILEVDDEGVIEEIRTVCDEFFTAIPYRLQTGRFMKSSPSLVDYAKYGPNVDEAVVGLVDPRKRDGPTIIPRSVPRTAGEDCLNQVQREHTSDKIN